MTKKKTKPPLTVKLKVSFDEALKALTPPNPVHKKKCPECLQTSKQSELDMFGGLCEECSGAFD